jgi:hypothetical protein
MKKVYIAGDRHDNAKSAKQIAEAIEDLKSIGLADILDRNRPYNGQRWTDDGARGKQEVKGITMRDIRDCLILAFYDARPPECNPPPKEVEDLPLNEMSLESISQHLTCWIERYMGIYPNIKA